jgi:hypothetical protein
MDLVRFRSPNARLFSEQAIAALRCQDLFGAPVTDLSCDYCGLNLESAQILLDGGSRGFSRVPLGFR